MAKYNLTYDDRLILVNSTFPATGDILTLRSIKALREALKLTEEEEQDAGFFTLPDNRFQWKDGLKGTKEFDFKRSWEFVIKTRLEEMNARKELSLLHLPLYSLFVMPEDTDDEEPTVEAETEG